MSKTVYQTKGIRTLMRWLAQAVLGLTGWKPEGQRPARSRYVIIAAPHTSNWDFLYVTCMAFIYRLEPMIMMKAEWFFWPLGPLLQWLGAIPVDRSKSHGVVEQSVAAFRERKKLALIIPPSGTRRRVTSWKTGFYHIACGARVPIALGFLDYRRKVGGFGPLLYPSGDIVADMHAIRRFYRDITARHPRKATRFLPAAESKPRT